MHFEPSHCTNPAICDKSGWFSCPTPSESARTSRALSRVADLAVLGEGVREGVVVGALAQQALLVEGGNLLA